MTVKRLLEKKIHFVHSLNYLTPNMAAHFVRILVLCKRQILNIIEDILSQNYSVDVFGESDVSGWLKDVRKFCLSFLF